MPRPFFVLVLLVGCTPMPELHFNEPPGPPTLGIEPAVPTTSDTLVAGILTEAVDPEGDEIGYTWIWYKDGVEVIRDVRTVAAAATGKGQVWEVAAIATDGEFAGQEARASVTIVNSAPELTRLTISPTAPTTTQDLVLAPVATDADIDAITFRIRWSKDGVEQPLYDDETTIPAAATSSLEDWTAVVAPTDGSEAGASESVSVYVDNTVPTLGSLRVLPTDPTVDDAIGATVLDLVDPDQPEQTVSVEFVWYVNGAEVLRETETDGNSYLSDAFVKRDDVTVSAAPYDGYVYGTALTSTPLTVVNTPPALDEVTLTPSSGYESTTFTCVPGTATDADGDPVGYGYAWYVDGVLVSATTETLTGSSFAKTDTVYCVATPEDGEENGLPVTSSTVTVLNSVPTMTGVSISPSAPTSANTLTATVTGGSDADGDSISYVYAWTVNGVSAGGSTSQLNTSQFERDDEVQVTITPSDSSGSGTATTSSTVTIENALPSISSANVTPSNPYTDDQLTVSVSGWSDADDDSAAYTYQWYKNSAVLAGATARTLDATESVKGDRVYCAVTPDDGFGAGTTRNTPMVTILNSSPATLADIATGLTATECDVIELDASGTTDEDGDSFTYAWSLSSKPTGSLAATSSLSSTTAESPTFLVDLAGSFVFYLAANDGSATSSDTVTLTVYDAAGNEPPVAAPEADDADLEQNTGCSSSGSGYVCTPCSGTFTLDGGASYDEDGDPLHYTWSTTSGYASITSASSESTTVTMRNMPTAHLTTYDYQATITLRVQDCAGNTSIEDLLLTYACTGN
jgi:hypothetical protein